jgi:hypothetical protein
MAREQLNRKVGAHPEDALLLSSLSLIDAALNLNQEAVEEAKRAMAMRPISADARGLLPCRSENLCTVENAELKRHVKRRSPEAPSSTRERSWKLSRGHCSHRQSGQ